MNEYSGEKSQIYKELEVFKEFFQKLKILFSETSCR